MKLYFIALLFSCLQINAQILLPHEFDYNEIVETYSEIELIELLSNNNQDLRKSSASRIQFILKNNFNAIKENNIIEHEKTFWSSKSIAHHSKKYTGLENGKIRINTTSKEELLSTYDLNEKDIEKSTFNNKIYVQLDNTYQMSFRKVSNTVDLINIFRSPIYFMVPPKDAFNGTWYNFFVTGEIYSEIFYSNGIKTQENIYSIIGKIKCKKKYRDNICYLIEFCNKKGEITKLHYEILNEKDANEICQNKLMY